jgi:hypothetical protein
MTSDKLSGPYGTQIGGNDPEIDTAEHEVLASFESAADSCHLSILAGLDQASVRITHMAPFPAVVFSPHSPWW